MLFIIVVSIKGQCNLELNMRNLLCWFSIKNKKDMKQYFLFFYEV